LSEPFRPLKDSRLYRGTFVERPNRFIIHCAVPRHGVVEAFVANPGRMDELLFPGRTPLTLTRVPAEVERRTRWTVVGCETPDGEPLFLDTHRTNDVAAHLVETGQVPGLKGWRLDRREVRVGHSRFDLQLAKGSRRLFVEVKSCTLFGGDGVAMFPDAVTERGRRHMEELANLSQAGAERPVVLFIVHSSQINWFMPDFHTDLAFSQTFLNLRDRVRILPVGISWTPDFSLRPDVSTVQIPWAYLRREVEDRGAYLLLLRLHQDRRVTIGRLGEHHFAAGTYIYVGSAMANLSKRVERHLRRRKRHHWHIDRLRDVADEVTALPIRSSQRLECDLARRLDSPPASPSSSSRTTNRAVKPSGIPVPSIRRALDGFGCSDCDCPSHLFYSTEWPLDDIDFHRFLQHYRMRSPD
jgi:sugar fermentation stimulation protein A